MKAVFSTFVVLVFALVALGTVVTLRHEVRDSHQEVHSLHAEIVRLREEIHVLRAEWSHANRPEVLADLTQRHLELVPAPILKVERIALLPRRADVSEVKKSAEIRKVREWGDES